MARLNLLTIHWGCSYGGTMQTYATVKILQNLGHQVQVINLVNPKVKYSNLIKHRHSLAALLYDFNMNLKFYLFRKNHIGHFTKRMYKIDKNLIPDCDYTIVGSDQVWNSDITKPIELSYFLDFVNANRRIAFSSSFGKFKWEGSEKYTMSIKKLLDGFKAISVREESGVEICESVFNINAIHVLDPTLILCDYSELINRRCSNNKIYSFLLNYNDEAKLICDFFSKESGMTIFKPNKIQSFIDASPKGWLKRMNDSEFIITDSFHGLAFSIILHKNFIVLCADEKKFARLLSLLRLLHLEDRYIRSYNDLVLRYEILQLPINYVEVDKILERERQKALSFLKDNLI